MNVVLSQYLLDLHTIIYTSMPNLDLDLFELTLRKLVLMLSTPHIFLRHMHVVHCFRNNLKSLPHACVFYSWNEYK